MAIHDAKSEPPRSSTLFLIIRERAARRLAQLLPAKPYARSVLLLFFLHYINLVCSAKVKKSTGFESRIRRTAKMSSTVFRLILKGFLVLLVSYRRVTRVQYEVERDGEASGCL